MGKQDIRWKQRYENYLKALNLLQKCIPEGTPSYKDMLALIQAFEMTVELGWNLIKDYLKLLGVPDVRGPKEVIRYAHLAGMLTEPEAQIWLDAIDARNKTSHAYNESVAEQLTQDIENKFLPKFENLEDLFRSNY